MSGWVRGSYEYFWVLQNFTISPLQSLPLSFSALPHLATPHPQMDHRRLYNPKRRLPSFPLPIHHITPTRPVQVFCLLVCFQCDPAVSSLVSSPFCCRYGCCFFVDDVNFVPVYLSQNPRLKRGVVPLHVAVSKRKRAALGSARLGLWIERGSASAVRHLLSETQRFSLKV